MDAIEKALYDLCNIPADERPTRRKGSKTDLIAIYPSGERIKIVRLSRGWRPDFNVYCDLLQDAIAYHEEKGASVVRELRYPCGMERHNIHALPKRRKRSKPIGQRDSQRQKVYNAENAVRERLDLEGVNKRYDDMAALTARVDAIYRSAWWKGNVRKKEKHCGPIKVTDGRHCRSAIACGTNVIKMPRWARSEMVLLHELSHIACARIYGDNNIAAHGREFCRMYLSMVRRFMGRKVHDMLRDSFRERGVKYRKPINLSPEERERRRQRAIENLQPATA